MRSKTTTAQEAMKDMGNAPTNAYEKAERKFIEFYGDAKVEGARWFVVAVIMMVVCLSQSVAIYQILPLKTSVPYMVSLSQENGVTARIVEAKNYTPDRAVKMWFLSRFVENMRTLDPYTTPKNIKEAYSVTRDKASAEYTDYIQKENPIAKLTEDKSLIRTVKINTINPGTTDNIAFIRTTEEERSGAKMTSKNYLFTLHYEIVAPANEAEILKNPAGIFITHFVKSEEL